MREFIIGKIGKFSNYLLMMLAFGLPLFTPTTITILIVLWVLSIAAGKKVIGISKNRDLKSYFLLFTGLFFLSVVGLTYTQNLNEGLIRLGHNLSLFVFPLVFFATSTMDSKALHRVLVAFILGVAVAALVCLYISVQKLVIEQRPMQNIFHYDIYYNFTNPIKMHSVYFSMYITFGICILTYFLFSDVPRLNKTRKVLAILVIIFFVFNLLVLSSRMQLIILFVLLNFSILWLAKNPMVKIVSIVALNFLLVLGIYNSQFTHYQFQKFFEDEMISETSRQNRGEKRLTRWKSSLGIFSSNWLIGVGTGDVRDELNKAYERDGLTYARAKQYNAHNQYLQTAMQMGTIGLAALLACIFIPLQRAFESKNIFYVFFLLLFSLSMISESMLLRQEGVVFYAFFNSLFAFHSFGKGDA